MLKKIALVTLFVVSAAIGASTRASARSTHRIPVATTPQGFPCPAGHC